MKARGILLKQLPEHIAVRSPAANVALLEAAGFRVIKLHLISHCNVLKCLHIFSLLPLVGRFFKARIFIEAIRA